MGIYPDAPGSSPSLSDAAALEYDRLVNPNVYAVQHLYRSLDGVAGCPELYENESVRVLARVTQRVFGKNAFRRRQPGKRLIANLVSLETRGGPHLNLMLRRPERISLEQFRDILSAEWLRSAWAQRGHSAFYCEEREPGSSLVGYCSKEGIDALLLRSLSD